MGNWRTVHIVGTCAEVDVLALSAAVDMNRWLIALDKGDDIDRFHCLLGGSGLMGLPNWASESIDAVGNLAERDYGVEVVRDTLERLARIAPSLAVVVHCGGDFENTTCTASVVLKEGKAEIHLPQVADVGSLTNEQIQRNFLKTLIDARNRRGL